MLLKRLCIRNALFIFNLNNTYTLPYFICSKLAPVSNATRTTEREPPIMIPILDPTLPVRESETESITYTMLVPCIATQNELKTKRLR